MSDFELGILAGFLIWVVIQVIFHAIFPPEWRQRRNK